MGADILTAAFLLGFEIRDSGLGLSEQRGSKLDKLLRERTSKAGDETREGEFERLVHGGWTG